jgi:hypothetical protein
MAAALVLPISGPYLGLYEALSLGTQDDNGFELAVTVQGQEINASDAYGLTLVEGIFRGLNWRLRLRGLEWDKPGLMLALQQFGQTGVAPGFSFNPNIGVIGDRMSTYSGILVLAAILGNPPTTPQTLTASTAFMSVNMRSDMMFTSKLRELPMEFCLVPYEAVIASQNVVIAFSTT